LKKRLPIGRLIGTKGMDEIKYPINWFVEDEGYVEYLNGIRIIFCNEKEKINNKCPSRGTAPHTNIYLFKFEKTGIKKELYSFIFEKSNIVPRDYWPWGCNPNERCKVNSRAINGRIAKFWDCSTSFHIFWEKDSFFYNMNVYHLDAFPELKEIFNQMLSTFRFLE